MAYVIAMHDSQIAESGHDGVINAALKRVAVVRAGVQVLTPAKVRAWFAGDSGVARRMAATAFSIRVASAAVVFLSQIVLARWMGSFEYGVYVYVWTWVLLVGDLVHLGLPLTAQRNIPEYIHQGAIGSLRGYLIGSRWIVFGVSTLVAVAGGLIVYASSGTIGRQMAMPFYLACVALPFYALSFMLDGIARSYNWMSLAIMPHSLIRPVLLLAEVSAAHAFGVTLDATTIMFALVIAIWLPTLAQLLVLNRRLRNVVTPGRASFDVMGWLSTSLPTVAVWGFYTGLTCSDVIILQFFRPADEVAHYFAATKTLSLVTFIYFAVAASAAHKFTALHVAGDRKGLAALVAGSIQAIFWPSLIAIAALLFAGPSILSLFGPGFVDIYPAMFILAIGLMARASVGPAERLLTMVGSQNICALAYAAAFLVNVSCCLLLARRYGGIGVAIGTAAAYLVESALLFAIARRRLGIHLFAFGRSGPKTVSQR